MDLSRRIAGMGTFVLSIDAELAWGFHDMDHPPLERVECARAGWTTLLELLDHYDLPATWAVVGHLMLDWCDGIHAAHPTPSGWFEDDPGGCATADDVWRAPDLVRAILDADVDHEIASHSFSHVQMSNPWVTPMIVDAELARHRDVAEAWDLELQTFVFPRNDIGFLDRLPGHDFIGYRGRQPRRWYEDGSIRSLGKAIAFAGAKTPPIVTPTIDEYGLVNVPASIDLFGFEGTPKRVVASVTGDPIVNVSKRGIDAITRTDGVLHGWLHPNNIATSSDRERLAAIFAYLDTARERGDVTVKTMADVSMEVLERGER